MPSIHVVRSLLALPAVFAFCISCTAQVAAPVAPAVAAQTSTGTLLQFDFNGANPWPKASADVMPSTPIDVATSVETGTVGTIDEAGSTKPSGGLLLKTDVGKVGLPWIATYASGLFPIQNTESNLGKLTLAMSVSASSARPVIVRIESFNAKKNRSGGLETSIDPAAPDFYQRFALDLNTMTPSGDGKFVPTDPFVQVSFELRNPAWPDGASHELRIDNVQYARPAFYVNPQGDDNKDGKTEQTAFASPQKPLTWRGRATSSR